MVTNESKAKLTGTVNPFRFMLLNQIELSNCSSDESTTDSHETTDSHNRSEVPAMVLDIECQILKDLVSKIVNAEVGERYVSVAQFKRAYTYYALGKKVNIELQTRYLVIVIDVLPTCPWRCCARMVTGKKQIFSNALSLEWSYEAVTNVMPNTEHRQCARHIYENFRKHYHRFWHVIPAGGNLFEVRPGSERFLLRRNEGHVSCWDVGSYHGFACVYATR
ncbi:hypothetical protein Tco_0610957 [Tanacetum coccineum]